MESQNIDFRAFIKFLTKDAKNASEVHRHITNVAKWSANLNKRDSLKIHFALLMSSNRS